jgi:hypothetical protein
VLRTHPVADLISVQSQPSISRAALLLPDPLARYWCGTLQIRVCADHRQMWVWVSGCPLRAQKLLALALRAFTLACLPASGSHQTLIEQSAAGVRRPDGVADSISPQ